jgi:hypothetical protein
MEVQENVMETQIQFQELVETPIALIYQQPQKIPIVIFSFQGVYTMVQAVSINLNHVLHT